jgi:hypothetical protein
MAIDPTIAATAFQQGGNFISTLLMNRRIRKENEKARDHNIRMSDLEYQRNLKNWHMQNEYNSPKAVMQRYIEAGINPHLIAGQAGQGLATEPQPYSRPEINSMAQGLQRFELSNMHGTILDTARIRNIIADTLNKITQNESQVINNKLLKDTYDNLIKSSQNAVKLQDQDIKAKELQNQITTATQTLQIQRVRAELDRLMQDISSMKTRQNTEQLDQKIKQFQITLQKYGVVPTDNIILRMMLTRPQTPRIIDTFKIPDLTNPFKNFRLKDLFKN